MKESLTAKMWSDKVLKEAMKDTTFTRLIIEETKNPAFNVKAIKAWWKYHGPDSIELSNLRLRFEARKAIGEWWGQKMDEQMFNILSGED